jgi:hypothetical protein
LLKGSLEHECASVVPILNSKRKILHPSWCALHLSFVH